MPDDSENSIISKVVHLSGLEKADTSIISSSVTQVLASLAMVILYLWFRRRAPWVYYSNIKNKPQHPCYQENPGLISWILPLITTKDTQLLSMVGLDGFMFLQTIKLLYRICFILSFLIVPFLCGWFYKLKTGDQKAQFFIALSIWDVTEPKVYWAVLGISYALTIIVFYLIFIYYKRFVTLRQLYLASPATMTSIPELKKISKELGSDQNAIDYINISSRTVLIDRLPSTIRNDAELLKYLESLKLGEIESVSLIHDTYNLKKMYEERNEVIQDIEKEVTLALNRIKSYYMNNQEACKESFGELYTGDLEHSANSIFSGSKFNMSDKVALFNNFCKYADTFFSKTWLRQNIVNLHIAKLEEVNKRILEEKKRIENDSKENVIDIPEAADELFVDSDIRNDVSFFSFSQITSFSENKAYFTLDLPLNKKKAFITFKDQKTAGIIQQTKIGSRAFSSNIQSAPVPNDVVWRTIGKDEVSGFFFKIISLAMYVLFILAFLYIVVLIIESLEVKKNTKNLFFRLLQTSEMLVTLYKSILVPLIYNVLLYFVPIIIKALIHMEDVYSFSDIQIRLMYRVSIFLFFNAFLATFIVSCVTQFTQVESNFTFLEIISEFSMSVIKASVFFFNTIVQRMCMGVAIVFLKPAPFLYNLILARFVIYTRRQKQEREFSPPIDFGNQIPNLLLILPMALVYSCICPIMLVISWIFYVINYLVYKNELLFATRNDFESGGAYWKPTVKFIFYSVITFQVVTGIFTYSKGFEMIFYGFLPLIFITFVFSEGLNIIFERSCENFPMNAPEEKFLDKFAKKTLEERFKILSQWKEIAIETDEDNLSITELGFKDEKADLSESLYKDPSLLTSIGNIILPENFYRISHFLKSFDQKNLIGLKK